MSAVFVLTQLTSPLPSYSSSSFTKQYRGGAGFEKSYLFWIKAALGISNDCVILSRNIGTTKKWSSEDFLVVFREQRWLLRYHRLLTMRTSNPSFSAECAQKSSWNLSQKIPLTIKTLSRHQLTHLWRAEKKIDIVCGGYCAHITRQQIPVNSPTFSTVPAYLYGKWNSRFGNCHNDSPFPTTTTSYTVLGHYSRTRMWLHFIIRTTF